MNKAMQHQDGKGQEVKPCQRLRQALIVARQAPKAGCPRETALDHESAAARGQRLSWPLAACAPPTEYLALPPLQAARLLCSPGPHA